MISHTHSILPGEIRRIMMGTFLKANARVRAAAKAPIPIPRLRQEIEAIFERGVRQAVYSGGSRVTHFQDAHPYTDIPIIVDLRDIWRIVPLSGERNMSPEKLASDSPRTYITATMVSDYFPSMAFVGDPFGARVYYAGWGEKGVASEDRRFGLRFLPFMGPLTPLSKPLLKTPVNGYWSPGRAGDPDYQTIASVPWFVWMLQQSGHRMEPAGSTVAGIMRVLQGHAAFYISPAPPLPDTIAAGSIAKSVGFSVGFYEGGDHKAWSAARVHPLMDQTYGMADKEYDQLREFNRRSHLPMMVVAHPSLMPNLQEVLGLPPASSAGPLK